MTRKTVLVVGFFDMFHSGHVEFFRKANEYGEVYVSIATDENSIINKHKRPVYTQEERKFMVDSCKYVLSSEISYGRTDVLSFAPLLRSINPDIFIINEDGDSSAKRQLCEEHDTHYIVLPRTNKPGIPPRSTSKLGPSNQLPLRLDFVSFFDQKLLNGVIPGSVIVANIDPIEIDPRSGMSSSTLRTITDTFKDSLPTNVSDVELAKVIFILENQSNKNHVSGAVDQIGICCKGIHRLDFSDDYWPHSITKFQDNSTIDWINKYVYLVQTKPRPDGYVLYDESDVVPESALTMQNELVEVCWDTLIHKDLIGFGRCINDVHDNQKAIWPNYESSYCEPIIQHYRSNHVGCKLMGAGGYGYAMVISERPESKFIKVNVTK
jgi:cytidyltransferase-like protein